MNAPSSLAVGFAACVLSVGCGPPETQADWVRHQLQVGGHAIAIALPAEFQATPDISDGAVFSRPGHRYSRELRFSGSLPSLGDRTRTVKLGHDSELRYGITQWEGAGSGGPEAELAGHLSVGDVAIGVTARDQDEFSPNPEWCIKYLKTLQVQ